MLKTLAYIVILSLSLPTLAATRDTDRHDGYIRSLEEEELASQPVDVVLVPPPAPVRSVLSSDVIFDRKLTLEFQERYREKFGYTQAEQIQGVSLLYVEQGIAQGTSVESDNARNERRGFAEYMFRRLAEHHVDAYFRSDPALRSVWELKERVSNVEVKVSQDFSVQTIYSFSGNFITVNLNNPYANTRVRLEMNPASFGPSQLQEAILTAQKQATTTVSVESHYKLYDGVLTLVGSKYLRHNMSTTLTGSTDFLDAGPNPKENRILAGFGYVY